MLLCDMLQCASLEENASKRRVPLNGPWSSTGWIEWTDEEWAEWSSQHCASYTKRDYKLYYEAMKQQRMDQQPLQQTKPRVG